jgi:twitching motility protein PilT
MACDLTALLGFAGDQGASDLHISAGLPPLLRIRGEIVKLEMAPLSAEATHAAIYDILNDEQKRLFEEHRDLDFAFEIPGVSRFRANVLWQQRGEGAVFRLVPTSVKSLDELGMPKVLKDLAAKEKGLVVVTGPTGSGKSTTLAAMVDHVNDTRRGHILTIEDPIEFVHTPKKCVINQREVGPHTKSFAAALRAALREDPDVILVGELRDLETTQLAISAAETGHLVFATLHTNSAAKTVDRIIDIFPAGQQSQVRTMLSESLEGVVAQSLLPAKDGKGRVAALEVLVGVPALRNLIREDKTAQILSVIQTGAQHGMQSLDQSLRDLVMQGRLSRSEAMKKSSNPKLFEGVTVGGMGGAEGAGMPGAPATAARPVHVAPAAGVVIGGPGAARPAPPPAAEKRKPGLFGR